VRLRFEEAAAEPALPFFTEWAPETQLPGRAPAVHAAGDVGMQEVRVSGDLDHINSWLGAHEVPIDVRPGTSGITAVILRSTSGDGSCCTPLSPRAPRDWLSREWASARSSVTPAHSHTTRGPVYSNPP
jgi:hypothetical protein